MRVEDKLRFVPSAVEGLPSVSEVGIFPTQLELISDDSRVTFPFIKIARWYRRGWLFRPISYIGLGVQGWPTVADRDWFHPPSGRYFRFYTKPVITVYMPDEPKELGYADTMFRRVQKVIALGGFSTFDLG